VTATPLGAQTDQLVVESTGVGIGTSSPAKALHVKGGDGATQVRVEETSATVGPRELFKLINNGRPQFAHFDSSNGNDWFFEVLPSKSFSASRRGTGVSEMQVSPTGDLIITGDFFSNTCDPGPCAPAPDYVFEPEYPLLTLEKVEVFVRENRHLPGVPSSEELTGPINVSKLQMTLLEKIEELTLYAIEQDRELRQQSVELEQRDARLGELERLVRQLWERVNQMESAQTGGGELR
jgi:hypothetical protein